MITFLVLNILVVYFAFFARYQKLEFLLKVSFALLFLFLALRYDFGNDYNSYLKAFLNLNLDSPSIFYSKTSTFEPGWIFLSYLFRPAGTIGFFTMIALLALFNCIVYYRFIEKYVPPSYYWLAVFLYVFDPDLLLTHASAMRQSVAISFFLISISYLYKKNAVGYFLCVGLAMSFHSSAIILLPVYLIGLCNWKMDKIIILFLLSVYILLILFGKLLKPEINMLVTNYFPNYAIYNSQKSIEIGTGLGLLFFCFLFVIISLYEKYQTDENRILFKLAIISYLVMPVSLIITMLGRAGMYFQPAVIVVMPLLFAHMKNRIIRDSVMILLISYTILTCYGFFSSAIWEKKFQTYHTIFLSSEF